nr:signal peptidase I [bacterium]
MIRTKSRPRPVLAVVLRILCQALKILLLLLFLWFVVPRIWIGISRAAVSFGTQTGLLAVEIPVAGTGSMYPTFPRGEGEDKMALANQVVSRAGMFAYPKGITLFNTTYFGHQIGRGDIVVVENEATRVATQELYGESTGWIKRVIAIAGDTLELRDGIVYLNDQALAEPYTARSRSTFAQTFLQDCTEVQVPDNSIFVMGDNRKGSGDSREVGFFSLDDVEYALPLANQSGELAANWRDTAEDFDDSARITLNKDLYLKQLNEERAAAGVKPLRYESKLQQSAAK